MLIIVEDNKTLPVKLDFRYVYGVDRIESFVSVLVRMGVIPELMIEGVCSNMDTWIHKFLIKEFS